MKKDILLIVILIVTTIYMVIMNGKVEKAITYFPLNEENNFKEAATALNVSAANSTIHWQVNSLSSEAAYLRQDIALLYLNGHLKGVLNKWEEDAKSIRQSETITTNEETAYFQAISFHHGEFHDKSVITSIQQMSRDELYLDRNDHQTKQVINSRLQAYWDKLINEYNLDQQDFSPYPFIELQELSDDLRLAFSSDISEAFIGQLWEGLYKNYILEAAHANANDMMPLILLAKDYSHLIILYTIDGRSNKLIQRLQTTH